MKSEREAAEVRAALKVLDRHDEVIVRYKTRYGNRKRREGEVVSSSPGRTKISFPDGSVLQLTAGGKDSRGGKQVLGLEPQTETNLPPVVHVLQNHSRVEHVERHEDDWVAYINGNSLPIGRTIEKYGGTVTVPAESPWNPDDDPRPMRFEIG